MRNFLLLLTPIMLAADSTIWADVDSADVQALRSAASGSNLDQSDLAERWKRVGQASAADIPVLLQAFDGATPVGTNWLSSAIDKVIEKSEVPIDSLRRFALDAGNGPRGREMALELLRDRDAEQANSIIDSMLRDPDARLRRPAVQRLLDRAKAASEESQLEMYKEAFEVALDERHVVASVVALRNLGHPVDHIRKFGHLMHWQIIGPFPYDDGKGFERAFPPESLTLENYNDPDNGVFSGVEFEGQESKVRWKEYVNTARNGEVSLNKAIDELRDSVGYGATVFEAAEDMQAQLRLRQQNSAKLWLNGKLVFSQSIGHTGNFFDQYVVPVKLRKGPNLILVKSCQVPGPVEHPFLNAWQFGVRVTDATGNAILATNRPPTPELDPLPDAARDDENESSEEDSKEGDYK